MSVTQFGAILSLVGAALFPLPTLLPLRQPDFETPSSCLGHAGVPGTTHRPGLKELTAAVGASSLTCPAHSPCLGFSISP